MTEPCERPYAINNPKGATLGQTTRKPGESGLTVIACCALLLYLFYVQEAELLYGCVSSMSPSGAVRSAQVITNRMNHPQTEIKAVTDE